MKNREISRLMKYALASPVAVTVALAILFARRQQDPRTRRIVHFRCGVKVAFIAWRRGVSFLWFNHKRQ